MQKKILFIVNKFGIINKKGYFCLSICLCIEFGFMEIIEKKIAFEDIDMVQLLGVNDKYLHQIERNFEANLISRGNNLIVLGSDDDIIKIEKIVKELSYLLQKNNR